MGIILKTSGLSIYGQMISVLAVYGAWHEAWFSNRSAGAPVGHACAARPCPKPCVPGSAPTSLRDSPLDAGKALQWRNPGAANVSNPQRVLGQFDVQANHLSSPLLALVDSKGETKRNLQMDVCCRPPARWIQHRLVVWKDIFTRVGRSECGDWCKS